MRIYSSKIIIKGGYCGNIAVKRGEEILHNSAIKINLSSLQGFYPFFQLIIWE